MSAKVFHFPATPEAERALANLAAARDRAEREPLPPLIFPGPEPLPPRLTDDTLGGAILALGAIVLVMLTLIGLALETLRRD